MRFFLWFFAVIGLLAVAIVSLGFYAAFHYAGKKPQIADTTILRFDFQRPQTEKASIGLADQFLGDHAISFADTVDAIRRAADDNRVRGLVARTGEVPLGLAQVQELRDAIAAFRAKGKFAYAFAESFGDLSGGTRAYYLSTAFDEIWLQPVGAIGLTGVAAELPFFKGTLDKLGVTASFDRRAEYKSAMTQLTETKLPDTDREAFTGLIKSVFDQTADGIAQDRKLKPDEVRTLIDNGPYLTDDALAKHLVDHIGYADEALDAAMKKSGAGTRVMTGPQYLAAAKVGAPTGQVIAVLRAVGEIHSGRSASGPTGDADGVASDDLVRAINQASRDSSVKAIVLRIDSPGGSALASETIWRALKKAHDGGKPLMVSMGDTAASGGYFIAAPADKIVAEPGTLTGSIGVFGGKIVTSGLWDKIGVSWDEVQQGQNAGIESTLHDYTQAQHERFERSLDQVYHAFIAHVADGRKLDPAKVEAIAKGRVWTGAQAKENGLVDELGGLDVAVRLAKDAAGIGPGQPIVLRPYPQPRSPLQRLMTGLSGDDEDGGGGSQIGTTLGRLAALGPLLERLDLLTHAAGETNGTRATMQPVELSH
ncbi:MAG TPA: signal peptide peptidase SppA [Aliidongia sp.]|uniref:signal peptide peptidase SppA n=1 Tax=Aliidongia sp. TaxID=1914230 RepID=UPI002DDCFB2E|nr:signal peptide peptidase SppA [Aliidongia sp.]HEV2677287.1 signal peptide peptidase SppA [Aliidongia sp.]